MQESPHPRQNDRTARRLRVSSLLAGAAVGGLAGLTLVIFWAMRARREALPPLTAEALRAAHQRWRERGPKHYQMKVIVKGSQTETYGVEVREGRPVEVTRNEGLRVKRATWPYWTVDGLLGVLDHDLRFVDDPVRDFGARPGSAVVLRARFDDGLGVPVESERVILSPASQMRWTVTDFRSREP